jgi:hypothetical protein
VPVEEVQSGLPGETGLAAVAKIEDVASAVDHEKFDRPFEFRKPLCQATRLLDASRAVAVAVHEKDWSPDRPRLPERRGSP